MNAKKYRNYLILSILGLIFSIAVIIYFHANNDNRVVGFYVIAAADIYALVRDAKRYKEAKAIESEKSDGGLL